MGARSAPSRGMSFELGERENLAREARPGEKWWGLGKNGTPSLGSRSPPGILAEGLPPPSGTKMERKHWLRFSVLFRSGADLVEFCSDPVPFYSILFPLFCYLLLRFHPAQNCPGSLLSRPIAFLSSSVCSALFRPVSALFRPGSRERLGLASVSRRSRVGLASCSIKRKGLMQRARVGLASVSRRSRVGLASVSRPRRPPVPTPPPAQEGGAQETFL
eukprot:gene25567-biopygen22499